ncbi:hypothetical protein AVEN_181507-1 [Araneus ventricosus]|uniref:SWIM-type domain-containing protein n=1 Tax=Araneus ventricosus TaxID=182803 RepID=A0A4Y2F3U7_ARAVE|nr:hypothetical protein AVEN_181507-1 [Araneus ventricosus]
MSDLQEFFSNYLSESDEEINETNVRKRKEQRKRIWIKSKEFETVELAINYVDNFKTWKKITTYNSSAGCKVTYRCTADEYRKNECPAGIYLLFHYMKHRTSIVITWIEIEAYPWWREKWYASYLKMG